MQTNFTKEALDQNPKLGPINQIIRNCVHCGFCLATCPSYIVSGNEGDSPRGRIYQLREFYQTGQADQQMVAHLDRCLTCLNCMTTCPSGVDYQHLIDDARGAMTDPALRPAHKNWLRSILVGLITRPRLFGPLLAMARLMRGPLIGLKPLLPKAVQPLISMIPMGKNTVNKRDIGAETTSPIGHIAMWPGCAQRHLSPRTNQAAMRLLRKMGYKITVLDFPCCGALPHHLGMAQRTELLVSQAVSQFDQLNQRHKIDALIVTASGCGVTVKDYAKILPENEAAAQMAQKAKDISEFLVDALSSGAKLPALHEFERPVVAWHGACSLQHGQKIIDAPLQLLKQAGFQVVRPKDPHLCCGAAGIYNILEPEFSTPLQAKKAKSLLATGAGAVATSNFGCAKQIADGMDKQAQSEGADQQEAPLPIAHLVEYLDWATGGQKPY